MTSPPPLTAEELDELEHIAQADTALGSRVIDVYTKLYLRLLAMARRSLSPQFDALAAEFTVLETWLHQNGAHKSHYIGASLRCHVCEALVRGRAVIDGKPSPIPSPPKEPTP